MEKKCGNCKHHEVHTVYLEKGGKKFVVSAECECLKGRGDIHSDSGCYVEINGEVIGENVDCPDFEE